MSRILLVTALLVNTAFAQGVAKGFHPRPKVEERASAADRQLAEKLARKLMYDRGSQGNVFDAFNLEVKGGLVTVRGYAHTFSSRDSALEIIASHRGVKGFVDRVEVLPASPMDDRIRERAAKRIYGAASLEKYALNPAHPIRVIVRNGHLRLEGAVLNSMDRMIAGLAVAGINGVLSVTNNLHIEEPLEEPAEK